MVYRDIQIEREGYIRFRVKELRLSSHNGYVINMVSQYSDLN